MKRWILIFMLALWLVTAILLIVAASFSDKTIYNLASLAIKVETGVIVILIALALINEFRKTKRLPSEWSCDSDDDEGAKGL